MKACDIPHEQVVLNAYLQYYRGAQDIRSALIAMENEWLINPTCKIRREASEADYGVDDASEVGETSDDEDDAAEVEETIVDEDDAAEVEETNVGMIPASQRYPVCAMAADGLWYSRPQMFAFYGDASIVKERFDIK